MTEEEIGFLIDAHFGTMADQELTECASEVGDAQPDYVEDCKGHAKEMPQHPSQKPDNLK